MSRKPSRLAEVRRWDANCRIPAGTSERCRRWMLVKRGGATDGGGRGTKLTIHGSPVVDNHLWGSTGDGR